MRNRRIALVALCLVTAVAAIAEAQVIQGRQALPTPRMLGPMGLERMWWNQTTMNAQRDKVRYLTADEELVIVQATSGMITALDAETGRRRWAIQLGRTDQASYPVVTNDEYALFVVGVVLYGVNRKTGETLWEIKLPSQPSTSPTTDQNQIYIGGLDGSLYAFDLHRIRELWQENLLPQYSHETLKWRYKTAREITSPAVSDGTRVSFASLDRNLYTVTADRRDLIFQFETDSPIAAPLGHKDNFLYLASQDFKLYCINALNGSVRWEFISGHPVRRAPRVVDGRVFVMPDHGGMICLNAETGQKVWPTRPKIADFLGTSKSYVFAVDEQDNIVVMNRQNGANVGLLPLRNFKVRVSNERTDRLFLATESGLVCGIREQGREWPQYHMYPDKKPITPQFAPDEPAEPAAAPETPTTEEKTETGNEN